MIFGALAIAGALSGRFRLPFTHGPTPLMIVGGGVFALGIYQLIRHKRG